MISLDSSMNAAISNLTLKLQKNEKPPQQQTMGLSVSTLRGEEEDIFIRYPTWK